MSQWGSKTLYVFNPEHDLALAVGKGSYTPPAEVVKLRKEKSLLPALYAGNGDFILILDDISDENIKNSPYLDTCLSKNIKLLSPSELKKTAALFNKIQPWGWDHAILQILTDLEVPDSLLPSQNQIDDIRRLSHRRTSIQFRKHIADSLNLPLLNCPVELMSVSEIETTLKDSKVTFFKAPWSSSGRGIVVSDHIKLKGLLEWCHGVIKHQGSVIAEPAWDKKIDFATEWVIINGKPRFMGCSVFHTSSRGKYHGNVEGTQEQLLEIIKKNAPAFSDKIIEAQGNAIKELIAPYYEGYLGIDMLADQESNINPCVELNLRLTMGHVEILKR